MKNELKITHIQTFSLHDGPGIRTTVFLAGCPLSCVWCHNPEARSAKPVLLFDERKCTNCRVCAACPAGAHTFGDGHRIDRSACRMCGTCIENCPGGALSRSVRTLTMEEYLRVAGTQARVIGEDGGITFSGGEPLAQGRELLGFLEETSVHRAVETCGYAEEELFREVVRRCDYVMFDLKLADDALHRKYTGVSNVPILKNLEILRKSGKEFLLRTPLIPGITDTAENLAAIERIAGGDTWEKLPYNPLAPVQYERMGEPYPLDGILCR